MIHFQHLSSTFIFIFQVMWAIVFVLNPNHIYQYGFGKSDQLWGALIISIVFSHPDRDLGFKAKQRQGQRQADCFLYRGGSIFMNSNFLVDNLRRSVPSTVSTTPPYTNQASPKTRHWNRSKTLSTLLFLLILCFRTFYSSHILL